MPVYAHVKWFLDKKEAELLAQPKPALFCQWSVSNSLLVTCAFLFIILTTLIAKRYRKSQVHSKLCSIATNYEAELNLLIGICTGICLIHCARSWILFAPNFVICAHCPQWLPFAECAVGFGILLGLFTRISAAGLLGLLAFTFLKHTLCDCLDLIPLYGIGFYFLLAGRNRYSLDNYLAIDRFSHSSLEDLGHQLIRLCAGLGFLILALDEKLIHPQLALDLFHKVPALNFMQPFQMSNEMFVLCAGLVEFSLGFMIAAGTLPRLAVIVLSITFTATTFIFGSAEIYGHAPYYGIVAAIILRGAGNASPVASLKSALTVFNTAISSLKERLIPQFATLK